MLSLCFKTDQEDCKSRQDHTAHLLLEAETQASKDLSEGYFPNATSIWCIPDSQGSNDLSVLSHCHHSKSPTISTTLQSIRKGLYN